MPKGIKRLAINVDINVAQDYMCPECQHPLMFAPIKKKNYSYNKKV